jgi:hypothetical protein
MLKQHYDFELQQSDFDDIDKILIADGKKPLNYKADTITQEQAAYLKSIFLEILVAGYKQHHEQVKNEIETLLQSPEQNADRIQALIQYNLQCIAKMEDREKNHFTTNNS